MMTMVMMMMMMMMVMMTMMVMTTIMMMMMMMMIIMMTMMTMIMMMTKWQVIETFNDIKAVLTSKKDSTMPMAIRHIADTLRESGTTAGTPTQLRRAEFVRCLEKNPYTSYMERKESSILFSTFDPHRKHEVNLSLSFNTLDQHTRLTLYQQPIDTLYQQPIDTFYQQPIDTFYQLLDANIVLPTPPSGTVCRFDFMSDSPGQFRPVRPGETIDVVGDLRGVRRRHPSDGQRPRGAVRLLQHRQRPVGDREIIQRIVSSCLLQTHTASRHELAHSTEHLLFFKAAHGGIALALPLVDLWVAVRGPAAGHLFLFLWQQPRPAEHTVQPRYPSKQKQSEAPDVDSRPTAAR